MTMLLGIDAGTTSLKVGLFDHSGAELATAVEQYTVLTPAPDRAELDPELYWSSLASGVAKTLRRAEVHSSQVTALAVSSQGETLIPLAAAGHPLGPAIVWLDNRAVAEARHLAEHFDRSTVYAVTGVPTMVPSWPACKLLWWRRHDPGLFHSAAHFCLVEEFLLHRLTGRFVSEAGVQSTSLLYDIVHRKWWQEMLDALNLPSSRLGELINPGEVVGLIRPAAARDLGLSNGVVVVAGGMDQGAGAVGVGNVIPGLLSESTGGALTVQATVDRPGGDPSGQTPIYVHSAANVYLYCPVGPTGGMALTWFRDHFTCGALAVADTGTEADRAYDLLTDLAARVPPGADGLTMLPHLSGAFSPEYEPSARGVFFGFTLGHGQGHFARAIMEGVAFMLRRNLAMLGNLGITAPELCSHGGGARSPLWNQIKADTCSMPVVTVRGTGAAVRGDAMLAGVATGTFASLTEACEAAVRPDARFEPDAGSAAAYEAAYQRYIDLFEAVRALFNWPEAATSKPPGQQPVGPWTAHARRI